jgi:hypothetical protein
LGGAYVPSRFRDRNDDHGRLYSQVTGLADPEEASFRSAPQGTQSTEIFAASAPFTVANQIQFQSWQSSAQESNGSVVVTVLRSSPATTAASVNYAVENGTATAGTDFTATSGTLNFAAAQSSQTFTST